MSACQASKAQGKKAEKVTRIGQLRPQVGALDRVSATLFDLYELKRDFCYSQIPARLSHLHLSYLPTITRDFPYSVTQTGISALNAS